MRRHTTGFDWINEKVGHFSRRASVSWSVTITSSPSGMIDVGSCFVDQLGHLFLSALRSGISSSVLMGGTATPRFSIRAVSVLGEIFLRLRSESEPLRVAKPWAVATESGASKAVMAVNWQSDTAAQIQPGHRDTIRAADIRVGMSL